MTGKEAITNIRDKINEMCQKLGYDYAGSSTIESYETLKEIVQKYDKYKRAFEILKDKLDLTARECCDKYKKAFKKDYEIVAYSYHTFINKEEYELLEELMKGE